jgi:hypothetical protein
MGARSNPVKEQALFERSAEARAIPELPSGAADSRGVAPGPRAKLAHSSDQPTPGAPRDSKVRRVEDLPASPIAYRPLRVEELPEAPGSGKRGRRAKDALAGTDGKGAAPAATGSGRALRVEDLPSVSAAVRPLRTDELNPELVQRADDLLWNHPAPVGVDVPLEVNGKSYVARFAYHYHEFGGAKKPWGYHKGVTLYSTHE